MKKSRFGRYTKTHRELPFNYSSVRKSTRGHALVVFTPSKEIKIETDASQM